MPHIEINNLVKRFGQTTALDGISLTVEAGQVHAFLGPNGAGKTTTIRCLLGILKATSGEVLIFGQDAWKHSVQLHRRIAYVPGDVNLWPNMTGGEVIDLFAALRRSGGSDTARQAPGGIDTARRQLYLERFDLDPTKKCRTYSKGNRQKVALVAAFASDAELLILDEPTSGLDPLLEKVFQDCIEELKDQGKSVFLSSHILSEVEKLADTISIIRAGRITESGSMAEISAKAAGRTLEEFFLAEYEGRQ